MAEKARSVKRVVLFPIVDQAWYSARKRCAHGLVRRLAFDVGNPLSNPVDEIQSVLIRGTLEGG